MPTRKQFAVLGLGRFGQSIVRTLTEAECTVLCCDSNMDIVQEMSQTATRVVQADVTDIHAMRAIGIQNFDVVVIAIGENTEASIMATLITKEMGVPLVIAKAKNLLQKKILERVGADRVVLPEVEMGEKVATSLISNNIIDFINISDKFSVAEVSPIQEWMGISLQKANIRAKYGLNIMAIRRGGTVVVSPKASEVIEKGDILVAIGETSDIRLFDNK